MSYKEINGLMRHLRENGIDINGTVQKRQLTNTGYFHGYKGYRFFNKSENRLPFKSYSEVYATIQYDSEIKSLMYSKMMFIETAIKNISLQSILKYSGSESIQAMYNKAVNGFNNAGQNCNAEQKRKFQERKLNLQKSVQASLAAAYKKGNPQITNFYNNPQYSDVPIWALFEIMTMGDFGFLLSCLTFDVRDDISKRIGINVSYDTNRELIYKYVYALKDLRNAIAHNAVVFDTRFRSFDPSNAMRRCLQMEMGLSYVNFKTIGDYIVLMSYYLKILHADKGEIKAFIRDFEKITDKYNRAVSQDVAKAVIHPDLSSRMAAIKNFV